VNRRVFFVKTHIPGLDEIVPGFPEGGLVLVSGSPGSGKTIFGMSYIYHGAVKAQEPGLYASMFENKEKFFHLSSTLGLDFEGLINKGLVEYLQLPLILDAGGAVNMILDRVESLGAKRLVIDSFTALEQAFKDPIEARVFLQTILSRVLERFKCTTILIKEGAISGQDFEEYVADVVICLEKIFFEDKRLRTLRIEKLRGAELRNPRVCFTIQKGVRVLPPAKLMTLDKPPSPDQVRQVLPPDPPESYTTGIPDLDREIGGYQKGLTVLFEIDPKLTIREYNAVVMPSIASHIHKGGYVMVIPSGGVTVSDLMNIGKLYAITEREFLEHVYIIVEKGYLGEKTPNVIELETTEGAVRTFADVSEKLSEKFKRQALVVIGVDRIVRFFGKQAISELYTGKEIVRRRKSLMMWILTNPTERLVRTLSPIADIHLRMTRRHGCVLLYGVKPRTPLYAIQPDLSGRIPIPSIIPIV